MNRATKFFWEAPSRGPVKYVLFPLVLIIVVLSVFGQVQNFEFVNWDDDLYVYANESIRSFELDNIRRWFTKPYVKSYVPLPMVSFALDYQLYGNDAGGYHRTSLIIHIVNVLLVYALLTSLLKRPWFSFFGGTLVRRPHHAG